MKKEQVAQIQLCGEPYQRSVSTSGGVETIDCNLTLDNLSQNTSYPDRVIQSVADNEQYLTTLTSKGGFYGIDEIIKVGRNLNFEEAFGLATFVTAALNRPLRQALDGRVNFADSDETNLLQATALLAAFTAKESYVGLTAEEIAGLVAATVSLDTIVKIRSKRNLIAFGGMGGDQGYYIDGARTKFFSLSTLGAITAAVHSPVHKHHSYPNTSKVGGQSAIEFLGARSDFHALTQFEDVLSETDLIMSSAHDTRTLHTLSHRLRGETINHVIGPLSFTTSPDTGLHAMIGVNEKISPSTIIDALGILDQLGFQTYLNSAAYVGTDIIDFDASDFDDRTHVASRHHLVLDEIAPPPFSTLVAFRVDGQNAGVYSIRPDDFYSPAVANGLNIREVIVPNTVEDIMRYNEQALSGVDYSKAKYLAMTVGLSLFVREGLLESDALDPKTRRVNPRILRRYTEKALDSIMNGEAQDKLQQYISSTVHHSGNGSH